MERLSGDLSWWKRGFGWGKSYLLEGGLVQQRLNTIITQMDWASWHPQLWNNTFWAQGVPLSPGFGEFSSGNFLRGGVGGIWALLFAFVCPKSTGRGAGQAHVELSPSQPKAWCLSILWVLPVLGEQMMLNSWCDAQTPTQPAADLNRASQSWRQIQAHNESRLIGAQNCYWHRHLLFFSPS